MIQIPAGVSGHFCCFSLFRRVQLGRAATPLIFRHDLKGSVRSRLLPACRSGSRSGSCLGFRVESEIVTADDCGEFFGQLGIARDF